MSTSVNRHLAHLLVVDLAAVVFSRRAGITTARLPDATVVGTCDTGGAVPPEQAAAETLTAALEMFQQQRFTADGRLVSCRLALYNPFSAQVEAGADQIWSGPLVGFGAAGEVVEVGRDGGFDLDGARFVPVAAAATFSGELTRALAAHS